MIKPWDEVTLRAEGLRGRPYEIAEASPPVTSPSSTVAPTVRRVKRAGSSSSQRGPLPSHPNSCSNDLAGPRSDSVRRSRLSSNGVARGVTASAAMCAPDIPLGFHSQVSEGAHDGLSHRDGQPRSLHLPHQILGDGGLGGLGPISSVLGPSVRSRVLRAAGVEVRKQSPQAGRWREAHQDCDCGPASQQCPPASLHLRNQ
jgi:hypothetical protein